jgi:hypothetical protein
MHTDAAAPQIARADDHRDLDAQVIDLLDFVGDDFRAGRINAVAVWAS